MRHPVQQLVAQRVYGLALGYEDLNDHDELRIDKLLGILVQKNDLVQPPAGESTLNRLELTTDGQDVYKKVVVDEEVVERFFIRMYLKSRRRAPQRLILDLDATDDPLHGKQDPLKLRCLESSLRVFILAFYTGNSENRWHSYAIYRNYNKMNVQPQKNILCLVAAAGLGLGGLLGMAGSFVPSEALRGLAWGIDGIALVIASALLAVHYVRRGEDIVAAGFLVFAVGQGLVVSGSAMSLSASAPSFAAGAGLWAAALLLISTPQTFPLVVRILGIIAAILFAITAEQVARGDVVR